MNNKTKKINSKYLHIAIIILGILFISVPIFHKNIWFDESYTVGIVSKSFADIWRIGSNDVHPVLYYWMLHIIYLIFGSNIYIYRFFSMIPLAILSILGYTHIRKDFGEKIGFIFSFLVLFLPISSVYSGEIRMYTWAMLFVSLMAIYAYRIYKQVTNSTDSDLNQEKYNSKSQKQSSESKNRIKNWILFAIFSLASCYTHYYGLATAGVINVILFIYLIVKAVKDHKENKANKIYTAGLKCFTVSAIIQILLYLPWFIAAVVKQLQGLSNGFWIPKPSSEILLQIFIFQFTGDLDNLFISKTIAIIFGIVISAYVIYCMIRAIIKNKNQEIKDSNVAGIWAIGIYGIVMLCILIISIKKPLLYARYFLNLTGIFIFFLAFFIAKGGRKILTTILSIIIIIVSMIVNFNACSMNYDESNSKPLAYVEQDLQEKDMLLFGNKGSGFVLSMQLIDVPNCFYDKEQWNVEPAYEAFGEDMLTIKTLEPLDDYKGRIWIIDAGTYGIYDELIERYGEENITLIKREGFEVKYHEYKYTIALIDKK